MFFFLQKEILDKDNKIIIYKRTKMTQSILLTKILKTKLHKSKFALHVNFLRLNL